MVCCIYFLLKIVPRLKLQLFDIDIISYFVEI